MNASDIEINRNIINDHKNGLGFQSENAADLA